MSLDELLTIAAVEENRPCADVGRRHQRQGEQTGWLCLLDTVLGDWPRTLRASLLGGLLLITLVVILAILVGLQPALIVTGLYVLHRLILMWQVQRAQLA